MSRWLSYRPPAPFIPAGYRHPRLDRGSLRRQRLQHRALAASQPCTGKCALTLQPTAVFHHRHPRLRPGILSCLWQGARRALWGGAPRSAQPPEAAYSGGGAIKPLFTQHQPCPICNLSRTLSNLHGHPFTYFCLVRKYLIIIHLLYQMVVKSTPSDRSSN